MPYDVRAYWESHAATGQEGKEGIEKVLGNFHSSASHICLLS